MAYYEASPARQRAMLAPDVDAPVPFDWQDWEPDELTHLPVTLTDPGSCSCSGPEPCGDQRCVWTRQTPLIDILEIDAITDDGHELFNVLEQRGITDLVIMGVHTNACVLGRPYGIRQLISSASVRFFAAT
jgi:hypothetical protein